MTRKEACETVEKVMGTLRDEYIRKHPDDNGLPEYIWKLYWVKEYLYRKPKEVNDTGPAGSGTNGG